MTRHAAPEPLAEQALEDVRGGGLLSSPMGLPPNTSTVRKVNGGNLGTQSDLAQGWVVFEGNDEP